MVLEIINICQLVNFWSLQICPVLVVPRFSEFPLASEVSTRKVMLTESVLTKTAVTFRSGVWLYTHTKKI